jgi:muconate cycloisomerase
MKIKVIEVFAISLPMAKPIKMSFEEVKSAENVLVRLETADGVVGWGGAATAPTMTGETVQSMTAAIRYLAPHLTGMEADDIPAVMMRAGNFLFGNQSAKAAIEMALQDALGKTRGVPVYELLGGKRRDRVALLRLVGTGKGTAADIEELHRRKAEGHVAFKIKVGLGDARADAERSLAICASLNDAAGLLLCSDANQGFSVDGAIDYVRAVKDTPIEFFEQPVAAHDIEGMARIARASRVKIGCDEGLHSLEDLKRHHEAGAAAGFSLKTIKLGGVGPALEAALLCDKLGLKVNLASKMAETSVSTSALLHIAAAVPAMDWGITLSSLELTDDIVKNPITAAGGHVSIPTGPGLGVEVDEAKVRRYAREA